MSASPPARGMQPRVDFVLPEGAEAQEPAEARGIPRDGVRMLVVNTSATLPAALDAHRTDGTCVPVHVGGELPDGAWVVELRRRDQSGPLRGAARRRRRPRADAARWPSIGCRALPPAVGGRPVESRLPGGAPRGARASGQVRVRRRSWPLDAVQTVFACHPRSAEMSSAGRPFTERLVVDLIAAGVTVAPVVLHCGLSSTEAHEPPGAEEFAVPAATAALVNYTRATGGRVVAVGTTVTRAVESATDAEGTVHAAAGRTELVLGPRRPARAVDGLLSGLHAPQASHLLLLEAVAGPGLVRTAYTESAEHGYLWHEFGDTTLFPPACRRRLSAA